MGSSVFHVHSAVFGVVACWAAWIPAVIALWSLGASFCMCFVLAGVMGASVLLFSHVCLRCCMYNWGVPWGSYTCFHFWYSWSSAVYVSCRQACVTRISGLSCPRGVLSTSV